MRYHRYHFSTKTSQEGNKEVQSSDLYKPEMLFLDWIETNVSLIEISTLTFYWLLPQATNIANVKVDAVIFMFMYVPTTIGINNFKRNIGFIYYIFKDFFKPSKYLSV